MFGLFDVNAFQMYRMDFPGKPEFERGVSGAREKMVSLKDEHEVACKSLQKLQHILRD